MRAITERSPLEYYLSLKYATTIEEAPESGYFVQIEDLPGCYAQGETMEEALDMIDIARKMWLEVAYEDGMDIPLPRGEENYSGKFFIRAPKSLHKKLVRMAEKEGVSLNQYLVATLAGAIGREEASGRKKS